MRALARCIFVVALLGYGVCRRLTVVWVRFGCRWRAWLVRRQLDRDLEQAEWREMAVPIRQRPSLTSGEEV